MTSMRCRNSIDFSLSHNANGQRVRECALVCITKFDTKRRRCLKGTHTDIIYTQQNTRDTNAESTKNQFALSTFKIQLLYYKKKK